MDNEYSNDSILAVLNKSLFTVAAEFGKLYKSF